MTSPKPAAKKTLDPAFAALLACPACETRPPLKLSEEGDTLSCAVCGRVYPVVDGIPHLVAEDAETPAPKSGAPTP